MDNYAKVEHPIKGLVPFKTYQYQQDLLKAYLNQRFNIVLKARQLGITAITGGFISWLCLFHKCQNVLIIGTKQEISKTTLRVVKNIVKNLPKWMVPGVVRIDVNNRTGVEFTNGSRISAVTTTKDAGRSSAISLLFVDECRTH